MGYLFEGFIVLINRFWKVGSGWWTVGFGIWKVEGGKWGMGNPTLQIPFFLMPLSRGFPPALPTYRPYGADNQILYILNTGAFYPLPITYSIVPVSLPAVHPSLSVSR
jgi:hypothetical protein